MAGTIRFSNAAFGVPDFGIVDVDVQLVASALQGYIERGSQIHGVSVNDISMGVKQVPANPTTITLVELLQLGMRMFDAIVWLSAKRPTTPGFRVDPTLTDDRIPPLNDVAKALFYTYFFLLTQARYPSHVTTGDLPKVPQFLSNIMGLAEGQHVYINKICSFEPQKFNAQWIKYVTMGNFGQESLSRFGLGVAGYRLFGPFKLYKPKNDMDPRLQNAVTFASTVAVAPPTWDVHPSTRSPAVLTRRGNLNKNLGNLILDVFTQEQIAEMVASRILYAVPTREARCKEYENWGPNDDISGTNFIFP